MDIDTIIYAIVAAILLIRLWSVLGRRDSDDVTRPNPFVAPPSPQKETADAPFNPTDDTGQPIPRLVEPFVLPPNSLAGGLEKIQTMDPTFDEKKFLQGARSAFSMIIENFAANHIESIERLLGEKVLAHFRAAVLERQKTGQTMESKIISITEAEITAVKIE